MSKRIIIPEEELHDIADAINNRADYLDDINADSSNRDSLTETADRQMYSKDMAANILKLTVNLGRYYTKTEIDAMFANETIDLVYVAGSLNDIPVDVRSERILYLVRQNNDLYSVWVWHENDWKLVGGDVVQSDLDNYYTKQQIDEKCDTKQDTLTAGDHITIDSNNVISADINRSYKYEATLGQSAGDYTQGTLEEVPNPNDDPIFAILGKSPIYITLDQANNGYIVINLNPDALVGSTNIPLDNSTTKVATTKFVGEKIEEAIHNLPDYVKYIIFNSISEEESYPDPKEDGTIYANNETGYVYFGDKLLNQTLWHKLPEVYEDVFILYHSGFSDLSDRIRSVETQVGTSILSYKDVFYNPWENLEFVTLTAESIADPSISDTITSPTSIDQIISDLNITNLGDESNPVIDVDPVLPTASPCPWRGWSSNGGKFAFKYSADDIYQINSISAEYNSETIYDSVYVFGNVPQYNESVSIPSEGTKTISPYRPGYTFVGWCTINDGYIDPDSHPEDVGFKIDPTIVDWSWSGALYATWTEIYYSNMNTFLDSYTNAAVSSCDTSVNQPIVNMYDYNRSENPNLSYRKYKLTIATKSGNNWAFDNNFTDIASKTDFTRVEFDAQINTIIQSLIENEQIQPATVSSLNPITETVPSENNIFCIYIEGYTGTGSNISIESTYLRILKGWSGNKAVDYR